MPILLLLGTSHHKIILIVYVKYCCIRCRKDNSTILKYAIIRKLGGLFEKSLYNVSLNNEFIPILNIYMTGDLAF